MDDQALLFAIVKNHRRWLAKPEFLRDANLAQMDALTYHFANVMTKSQTEEAFNLIRARTPPDCSEAIRLMDVILAKAGKKTFYQFFLDMLQVYNSSTVLRDKHQQFRYFSVLTEHMKEIDALSGGVLIARLGVHARSQLFLDMLGDYFDEKTDISKTVIAHKMFDNDFEPTHPLTVRMQDFLLENEPVFFFGKSARFASDKRVVLRMFETCDIIPPRAFRNVNFRALIRDKDFMMRMMCIPEVFNKLRRTYSQLLDNAILLGMVEFMLSAMFVNSFALSVNDDVFFMNNAGEAVLFNRQNAVSFVFL